MKNINKKLNELPKEYFAQKFSVDNFPPMSCGVSWSMFFTNMIFYIVNIINCFNDESKVIKFTSIGIMCVVGLLFIAKIYWSNKRIAKHKVAFIHYSAWIFGELRLMLLSMLTYATTLLIDDNYIGIYIGGAILLISDITLNILFWGLTKKRIIEGAFKKNGNGFFKNIKNKDKKYAIIQTVAGYLMSLSLAFIALSRFIKIDWDNAYNPILIILFIIIMSVISFVFAYLDALLLGRAYYVKRFEIGDSKKIKK